MKKSITAITLLTAITMVSCKKETIVTYSSNDLVTGYWKGSLTQTGSTTPQSISILFRSNGSLRLYNAADTVTANKSEGVYNIGDSKLRLVFTYSTVPSISQVYTMEATRTNNQFNGTFGYINSTTDGGTFFIDKQ